MTLNIKSMPFRLTKPPRNRCANLKVLRLLYIEESERSQEKQEQHLQISIAS